MSVSSPITRQTVGKTFIFASSLLGLVALAEVSSVAWAFVMRFRETSSIAAGASSGSRLLPGHRTGPVALAPEVDDALAVNDPFNELPATEKNIPAAPARPAQPITPPPKPTPLTPGKLTNAVPQTRFDELIQQGRALRERGDTSSALIRFREAQTLDPRNPLAIAEAAMTYEKMTFYEKAAEQWKRIYDMGESAAGSYYIAADARLKQSQTLALLQAQQSGAVAGTDVPVSTTNSGATLGIGVISMEEQPDENAERKFALRVPLRARPRARIEVRDVVIQVLFYDLVDNKDIVQTNANVNSRWASTPPDWSDGDTEVLEVEYEQAKAEPKDATRETRKYFGYIVRLYYKNDLQDSRAEPARLGAQFPAPTTLPQETSQ
jgi:tetratricopeptide (TPR) repeat protein